LEGRKSSNVCYLGLVPPLSRNLDFLATDDPGIPILTVHQSKGLEFDTVFVAGMTEDEFLSYYSKRDRKLEEEKRLFYVAITRAKRTSSSAPIRPTTGDAGNPLAVSSRG